MNVQNAKSFRYQFLKYQRPCGINFFLTIRRSRPPTAAAELRALAKGEKMAWFIDSDRVKRSTKTELKHWNDVHRPGEEIPHSGIYFCTGCNKEIACNEGDPFPPQNHSQHSHSAPPIRWKLLVKTE